MGMHVCQIGGKHDIFAVRAISSISKAAGFRSARFLSQILPKLKASCKASDSGPDAEEEVTDNLCELKSSCLDAIAAFLVAVPHEVGKHVKSIVELFLDYVDYNPSVMDFDDFDDGGGGDWGADGADDDDWGADDDDGFGADDSGGFGGDEDNVASDRSFQVRKSAINGLTNLFNTRPDLLKALAPQCAQKLLQRFHTEKGENEASARIALFNCMRALVQICLVADDSRNAVDAPPRPKLVRQDSGAALLEVAPAVCDATLKLLKKGESETMFSLLTDVVNVTCGPNLGGLPDAVLEEVIQETTTPLIADSYKDKAVQIAAFGLLRTIMVCHAHKPAVAQQFSDVLTKAISQGLQSRVIAVIVAACACAAALAQGGAEAGAFATLLKQLIELTERKYDGEKRKAACHALSCVLCNFGSKELGATQVASAVDSLVQALSHGDTRAATMTGLQNLCGKQPAILEKQGGRISATLAGFLKPGTARPLRLRALRVLRSMLTVSSANFGDFDLLAQSIDVKRPDVPVATAALQLASAILNTSGASLADIAKKIVPKAEALATTSVLNGSSSLAALTGFFQSIGKQDRKFAAKLYRNFAQPPKDADSKMQSEAGLKEIAVRGACMAALSTKSEVAGIASGMVSSSKYVRCLSFQALGGLGVLVDPSADLKVIDILAAAVRDSTVPAAKRFAAKAFGSLAASNIKFYLEKFRQDIQAKCDGEAAVTVLGQMIELSDKSILAAQAAGLLPTLLKNSGDKDESVRRMVSQALGRLAALNPSGVLPTLKAQLKGSHWSQAASIAALQFAIDSPVLRATIMGELPDYLAIGFAAVDIATARPEARVAVADAIITTLTTLYMKYLVDAAPYLRHGSAQCVMPKLLPFLKQVKEWRQTIDFGAFKKLVDRGVPIRLKVTNLLSMILTSHPKWFDTVPFYSMVNKLLEDEDVGVKVTTLKILCKLCSSDAAELVKNFKAFGARLRKTALRSRKLGKDASEGHEDYQLFYWGCGTMKIIGQVPGIERNAFYADQLKRVKKEPICNSMLTKFILPDEY